MQITSGIRSVLSNPFVYSTFQTLMGAKRGYAIVAEKLDLSAGALLLDIGCGPADIINYLPQVKYWGFDISEEYISRAARVHGDQGLFVCAAFDETQLAVLPKFDAVLLCGLLHHLDDQEATALLSLCWDALKPGGKVLAVDGCYTERQNPLARALIRLDRGRNVRDEHGYRNLAGQMFSEIATEVIHRKWIPYTLCYMTLIR